MPPRVIGPYRVLETLGAGGAGTVYRAIDRRTGESAALKLLSTGPALDPRAARRLAREFETLHDLAHPNVVRVFDTGVFHGYPYLAMELVEGLTLRQYLSLSSDDLARGGNRSSGSHSVDGFFPLAGGRVEGGAEEVFDPWSDLDDDSVTDVGPRAFDLSRYATEMPSEELDDYEDGPESVRALADRADEPDTHTGVGLVAVEPDVAWELPLLGKSAAKAQPQRIPDAELVALNRPQRVGRLTDAVLQLCQALAYIHAHGLIHRDLKPTNVMVDEDHIVRLMDFGLAKYLADDTGVTANGRLVGTFRYMAPEQILGEAIDARADLYSLGVILYELLAGRPPFDARTPYDLWQKVLETEPPSLFSLNPHVEPQLARVAHRLIRKEPEDRLRTAEEVYEALAEL